MSDDSAFLGIDKSVLGQRWTLRPADDRSVRTIVQRHGLDELIARSLVARSVGVDAVEGFMNPTLRALLPDPSRLRDMDRAADRLADAIAAGQAIAVFGDYDVDGATSSALLMRYLGRVGCTVRLYIPDRIKEGYGPNPAAMETLAAEGMDLVVCVDCGTMAHQAMGAAKAAGLEVIVVDHHAAEAALPPAFALVNPNRMDDDSGLGHLAACGLTFLVLVALNRTLRQRGFFDDRPEPDLKMLLDLVALGTVCDVVPLRGLNRALVGQGLKVMSGRTNAGLAALMQIAKVKDPLTTYDLGFMLGPRINAAGRVGRADGGARLLASDDLGETLAMGARLDDNNRDRKAVEAEVQADAIAQAEAGDRGGASIVVAGQGWHPGVIGIVAGRLRERYHRPACVIALVGGIGKGSGRSVPGVDLGAAILEARAAGVLEGGGGHPMAAGFTVLEDRLAAFRDFLDSHIAGQKGAPTVPILDCDGALSVGGATADLAAMIDRLGPFGAGNDEPTLVLRAVRLQAAREVGTGHVSCRASGAGSGTVGAIAFRALDGPLGPLLMNGGDRAVHLAGHLRVNHWQGTTRAQFHITDAAPADQSV